MGIKHLVRIEGFLRRNKDKSFCAGYFTHELGITYCLVLEAIDHLFREKKIKRTKHKNKVRYQWK